MLTDEELVLKAQAKDAGAENEILERYKGIVRSKARGYFLSAGEYDDLIQEGMIGLSSAISSYSADKGSSFKSFAILCIKRHLIDSIRKDCSKKNVPLKDFVPIDFFVDPIGEEETQGKEIEAQGANPEEIFIKEENYTNLLREIRFVLKEGDFDILQLYLEGATYREISEKMDCTPKYVDNAIQRIKKKISTILNEN